MLYFAQNLKYLREQNEMSQRELSEALGFSSDVVAMWEKDYRKPDIEIIVALAKYFDTSLDKLVLSDLRPPEPKYADNMAYLRKEGDMSQDYIGCLLGVKGTTISKYESKECPVAVEKLMKFAEFFGVSLEQLVNQDLSKKNEVDSEGTNKNLS